MSEPVAAGIGKSISPRRTKSSRCPFGSKQVLLIFMAANPKTNRLTVVHLKNRETQNEGLRSLCKRWSSYHSQRFLLAVAAQKGTKPAMRMERPLAAALNGLDRSTTPGPVHWTRLLGASISLTIYDFADLYCSYSVCRQKTLPSPLS